MKPRILILPVCAISIASLVAWRMGWDSQPVVQSAAPTIRRLAPAFELYDQQSQLVKFERYLGRTGLLLLFMGHRSAAESPLVRQLLDQCEQIEKAGVQIVVVGMATPFANREAEKQLGTPFPFPVLTDVNLRTPEPAPVHRLWGLAGDDPADVREGLFLIDRDGTVAWNGAAPLPVAEAADAISTIARGGWPP